MFEDQNESFEKAVDFKTVPALTPASVSNSKQNSDSRIPAARGAIQNSHANKTGEKNDGLLDPKVMRYWKFLMEFSKKAKKEDKKRKLARRTEGATFNTNEKNLD